MHTYRQTDDSETPWTVGFIGGPEAWHAIADFDQEWKAARYASFLNGGPKPLALLAEMFPADRKADSP